jgi:tetratricopeptide (TPR) repeat protein
LSWWGKLRSGTNYGASQASSSSLGISSGDEWIAAYFNRALAYRDMGEFDNSLIDFNSALRINPYNEYALYQRGVLKQEMGDVRGGAADIAAARSTNPAIAKEFERPATH